MRGFISSILWVLMVVGLSTASSAQQPLGADHSPSVAPVFLASTMAAPDPGPRYVAPTPQPVPVPDSQQPNWAGFLSSLGTWFTEGLAATAMFVLITMGVSGDAWAGNSD